MTDEHNPVEVAAVPIKGVHALLKALEDRMRIERWEIQGASVFITLDRHHCDERFEVNLLEGKEMGSSLNDEDT
jgi:hypothetical protein